MTVQQPCLLGATPAHVKGNSLQLWLTSESLLWVKFWLDKISRMNMEPHITKWDSTSKQENNLLHILQVINTVLFLFTKGTCATQNFSFILLDCCPHRLIFLWWGCCGYEINQLSLPTPFYSVLMSVSVFMALSPDVILCGWLGLKHQLTNKQSLWPFPLYFIP